MKFYYSMGPNPAVVRMVLAEKGMEVERVKIDLLAGENRREPYLSDVNPMGTLPALELDSGLVLSEITAIAEYLEELKPDPALIGSTAEERAITRMWVRRIDLNIIEPMTQGYRSGEGFDIFKDRMTLLPESADTLKGIARQWLGWLDGQIAGRTWIVGDRFTLADVMLFSFLAFIGKVSQPMGADLAHVSAWLGRVGERPSAKR